MGVRVLVAVGVNAAIFVLLALSYLTPVKQREWRRGKPVRLNFVRQESASCSEMVLLPAFNKSAKLPEGEMVAIEFLPAEAGEYEFACQMGMFRGKVIVEP